ncbi:aminodeoxychorismate synthase component I [Actinoplanes sp. NPDC026619]|uniref:aminodeoxychorismate synthase component I n=1 Tax=Actinoplanes sp. NPDC026619 TaxID=3155798 RepID=UPI0033E07050
MTSGSWARFDDMVTGQSLLCPPPHSVHSTSHPEDVPAILAEVHAQTNAGAWAFGYVSYEAAPGLDPTLETFPRSSDDPPLIWFGICDPPGTAPALLPPTQPRMQRWAPQRNADEHEAVVEQARRYIAAGEIYQCNLTERLHTADEQEPLDLYARLAVAQHARYSAYLDLGRYVIVSASPELFFEWADGQIRTRPMKGTAARHREPSDDQAAARQLHASAKERAENIMIVDLLRNDLAKIAVLGSVTVTELLALERYPTVWQMTSEIVAQTPDQCTLLDVFEALFPCGSVTGAPKARSMQIIRELEAGPRGVYCGAIGLVTPPTAAFRTRFNVAIRTAILDRDAARAIYGAGGGITWDSRPDDEWAELLSKAALLDHHAPSGCRTHDVARDSSTKPI